MSTDRAAWDAASFVRSSEYRTETLQRLDECPATPSTITEDTDIHQIAHASRALQELRERDFVELLVSEERTKGRIYGITDSGRGALEKAKELDGGEEA